MARTLLLIALQGTSPAAFRQGFVAENYLVDSAQSGERAVAMLAMRHYDAILVVAGTTTTAAALLARLRDSGSPQQPIIASTAVLDPDNETTLLAAGATLCCALSVGFDELLARLRALLRRADGYPRDYRVAGLGIDPVGRKASRDGRPLRLRPIEFDILLRLAEGAGRPVERQDLLSRVWPKGDGSDNLLAAHMRNLRSIVDLGRRQRLLHTVHGIGYQLAAESR